MADPGLTQIRDAPDFAVLANGQRLPDDVRSDITHVTVSNYVEGASMFTITFNNWDSDRQEFKGYDEDQLREGTPVEVTIGFTDSRLSLIKGEVTALEPDYAQDAAPVLKVHGYDRLHRLRRGRKTRSFTNMKDSQIADRIARDLGLTAQVEDTKIVHEYVLQNNQNDIDFLLERARRIRYEVVVQDRTLYFRKIANDQSDRTVSLQYGLTLRSFYPRLSTMQQVSEVIVQGWDQNTKQAIRGKARSGDEISKMGGERTGVAISEQAFFKTKSFIVDTPISSEGEATQIAKARFNDMAVTFITGEGVAIGDPEIRAGKVIELTGLGNRFSGLYYVTASTHVVDQKGYHTRFTVERNAT